MARAMMKQNHSISVISAGLSAVWSWLHMMIILASITVVPSVIEAATAKREKVHVAGRDAFFSVVRAFRG